MECTRVFEPDEDYDTTHASDGVSRYRAYLNQYTDLFRTDAHLSMDAARFAAAAWRIALPPTMSPGYVRCHGRVQASCVRWDDEGRPAVYIELAASPAAEAVGLGTSWRRWVCDEAGDWWEPDDFAVPFVVTLLRVAVPLARTRLPEPRYHGGRADVTTAKRAVQALCALLNAELAPVLALDPLTRAAS